MRRAVPSDLDIRCPLCGKPPGRPCASNSPHGPLFSGLFVHRERRAASRPRERCQDCGFINCICGGK
jgi:hypothetical protein